MTSFFKATIALLSAAAASTSAFKAPDKNQMSNIGANIRAQG